jgi:hypothetical protein
VPDAGTVHFITPTPMLAFDKVRVDPQAPGAYGVTVTYNLPLDAKVAPQWDNVVNMPEVVMEPEPFTVA